MKKISKLERGDKITVDGVERTVEKVAYIRGSVGCTVFYQGPFELHQTRFNSETYISHGAYITPEVAEAEQVAA